MTVQPDYQHLDRYMSHAFKQVQGWCHPLMGDLCKLLDGHQFQRGVRGGVAEIGVHHGLFFMLLNSLTESTDVSWAVDVFDHQALNIDKSGGAPRDIFLSNLVRFDRHRGENVQVVTCDSTTARIASIITQPIRLFSVDGGHTAEHTISDMKSAQSVLHPEGVVFVDDILNEHWIGVIEGVVTFLQTKPTLVPFAIGTGKLFLCNFTYVERYAALIRQSPFVKKPLVRFMGRDIVAV